MYLLRQHFSKGTLEYQITLNIHFVQMEYKKKKTHSLPPKRPNSDFATNSQHTTFIHSLIKTESIFTRLIIVIVYFRTP